MVAPVDDHGDIELDFVAQHLGDKTRFFATNHISNALGTVNPVREITALAHSRGVPVLIECDQDLPDWPRLVSEASLARQLAGNALAEARHVAIA